MYIDRARTMLRNSDRVTNLFLAYVLSNFGALDATSAYARDATGRQAANSASHWTKAERGAWLAIARGEAVDFNKKCGVGEKRLDHADEEDGRWRQPCRRLRGAFLAQILTQSPWREATPPSGIVIFGGLIDGDITLVSSKILCAVWLEQSRIEGALNLWHAEANNVIGISSSTVTGQLLFESLRASDVLLLNSTFQNEVEVQLARVAGRLSFSGSNLKRKIEAGGLQAGFLEMSSNQKHKAVFNDINLRGVQVATQVDLIGTKISGTLDADSLLAKDLLVTSDSYNQAILNSVDLHNARLTGQVSLMDAEIGGYFNAEGLQTRNLFLRHARFSADVDLGFAEIIGGLDLRGASFKGLNLAGATIKGDLVVGGPQGTSYELLNLRNAHVGNVSDEKDGWEKGGRLALTGFSFDRLGAMKDGGSAQTPNLDMAWWDHWARRDPVFSPSPYTQLANALKAVGETDAASHIRFLGRERAREKSCERGLTFDCFLQNLLAYGVGYGISGYAFRALTWVVFFATIGMLVWRTLPEIKWRGKSWLWCYGLALSRVLPVIELNKEFSAFFEGSDRPKLGWLQGATFYGLRLVGWILGAVVVAAVSGLTQGP